MMRRAVLAGLAVLPTACNAPDYTPVRDWARTAHAGQVTEILKQHAAGSGIAYLWEQQLLNTPVQASAG